MQKARSSLFRCSGRFLISISQCYRDVSAFLVWARQQLSFIAANYYLLLYQYQFQLFFEIKRMFKDENKSIEFSEKRKNRKDFLYRVGKLRENKILFNKQNDGDFNEEIEKSCKQGQNTELQQQIEFDLCLPPRFHCNAEKAIIQKKNNKFDNGLKVLQTRKPEQNEQQQQEIKQQLKSSTQNIEKEVQTKTQKRQNSNEKQTVLKNQKANNNQNRTVCFKPFVFDDFQQQIQKEEEELNTCKKDQTFEKSNMQQIQEPSSSQSSQDEEQIKGVTITSSSNAMQGNVVIKITNKKQLVLSRLPPGIILKCIIRRSKDIFNPEFDFYLNNGMKHIISAKKYSLAKSQIFKLSLELGKYQTRDIISTIMANTVHNIYWIYKQDYIKKQKVFQIKGIVKYQNIIKPGHRQMKANLYTDSSIKIMADANKLGHQIPQQEGLILKNGFLQAKQSSSKNYCLFDEQDKQYQYLKMQKVSQNMFSVQIQHPLSPLQAFSICLTRFDAQLK